ITLHLGVHNHICDHKNSKKIINYRTIIHIIRNNPPNLSPPIQNSQLVISMTIMFSPSQILLISARCGINAKKR
ncbi:MAG: hypothetical protein WCE96_10230, partial [Nitrososphaeraceae archaeon]